MKNAEAKVCHAAGPRWEAPWGAGGWRPERSALKRVEPTGSIRSLFERFSWASSGSSPYIFVPRQLFSALP